jgi:O-antigen chain-terminating methyltransferase
LTKRIVDESFARELEEQAGSESAASHDDLRKSLNQTPDDILAQGTGRIRLFFKRILFRLLRPVLNPILEHNSTVNRQLLDALSSAENRTVKRLDDTGKRLRQVYLKTGETLATLRNDLITHIDEAIERTWNETSSGITDEISRQVAGYNERFREEFRSTSADLIARTDMEIRYLEDRLESAMHDLDGRTSAAMDDVVRCLDRLEAFNADLKRMQEHTHLLISETGLEGAPKTYEAGSTGIDQTDPVYLMHQGQFRGDRDTIARRQALYVEYFREAKPVLDIGCGRGEFLHLLRENDIEARGIDINPEMVKACRNDGFEVQQADLYIALRETQDESVGGIFCAQVVEHLDFGEIKELLASAHRVLKPDGILIAETINPESVFALTRYFYLDPTHKSPLPPSLLEFYARAAGFTSVSLLMLAEAPESERLRAVDLETVMPGAIDDAFKRLNHDIERLNEFLFGHFEYAIVARK